MPSWIYCGSAQQVDAAKTQALLRSHQAIWCPPPELFPWPQPFPQAGEVLWLVWREEPGAPILILSRGSILAAPRQLFDTTILWTNPDYPGIRDAAIILGYRGPTNMAFLRLENISHAHAGKFPSIRDVNVIQNGLNVANEAQLAKLQQILKNDLYITIDYTVHIWQEGNQFIAHAMPLDVMSSGPTPDAARQALDEAVRLFLLALEDMGNTAEVLQECGYQFIQGSWKSPPWVAIERHSAVVGI